MNNSMMMAESFDNMHDFFAVILSGTVSNQIKRGLYKEYIDEIDELSYLILSSWSIRKAAELCSVFRNYTAVLFRNIFIFPQPR